MEEDGVTPEKQVVGSEVTRRGTSWVCPGESEACWRRRTFGAGV